MIVKLSIFLGNFLIVTQYQEPFESILLFPSVSLVSLVFFLTPSSHDEDVEEKINVRVMI